FVHVNHFWLFVRSHHSYVLLRQTVSLRFTWYTFQLLSWYTFRLLFTLLASISGQTFAVVGFIIAIISTLLMKSKFTQSDNQRLPTATNQQPES
ncbi:MAG: hypothetical protein IJT04_09480, partial [Bacteroidales bacterium]|nr:hypothetical protein [Bacteroidales bacterium]